MQETTPSVDVLGIHFKGYEKSALLHWLEARIEAGTKTVGASGNVHSFNLAYEQPWLHEFMNNSDFIRIDGAGLRLGARLRGHHLPARMTWADFIWDLAELASARGYSLFFLGGRPGVARAAAARLQDRYPALRIVSTQHGYFAKENGHPENEAVLADIAACHPDILIVGMGMPLQERWIKENFERLEAQVVMTAGAVFDYVSGATPRAPRLFRRLGLEWFGRLLYEPRRLWRRYLLGNPRFIWRVLTYRTEK